ncbi:MAG: hypothetical protein AVO33_04525 [delta proteobacterium ML8_F1]|nr:MAG: hypothetical protein AVO33_04525 [delta proteobacterium ML8_F1]
MEECEFTAELEENYGIVAHQMNTALTTIQLMLENIETPHRKELQSELVALKRYVDMLIPFLQIQDRTGKETRQSLSLDDIVKEVLRKSAMQFIANDNSLDFQPLDCEVYSNERKLALVIDLAIFAVSKNSKRDLISIYMDTTHKKRLVIENHTANYSLEDIEGILAQGYGGSGTKREKQTTGIELYVCHQILNSLSHRIYVTTNDSMGMRLMLQF